ncbi:hypothetical protein LX77_03110 [Gelidibacter algens]|uniref:PsbP protein n=1 Tax=Gelidibacter algens TaxID=49280 RepID=A0A1A7R2X6_9FLAO|nr:hypothetical protein [Gelidibacter algens]OBX25834.1 hypothetical protein A9996_07865 [Gelidibacter algens]RAJ20585.1 hypothetical protein LX77_03110 [Gelidibacter algens]
MSTKQKQRSALVMSAIVLMCVTTFSQTNKKPSDYFNVPGPIMFEQNSYHLNWSSHPSATYYKQEYIPKGETTEAFKTMLMLEVLTSGADAKTAVANKLAELKQMKAANPLVQFSEINNPNSGEYMIEFVLTANAADGTVTIAERNVYRYKSYAGKSGKKGVVLFAVSSRAYGKEVPAFFSSLKTSQNSLVKKVMSFKFPEITIR